MTGNTCAPTLIKQVHTFRITLGTRRAPQLAPDVRHTMRAGPAQAITTRVRQAARARRTVRIGPAEVRLKAAFSFISYRACVCMHAHTETRATSATQSMHSAASSMAALSVRHATMEQMQERAWSAIMHWMMQLSHLVFWMRRRSWRSQRVEKTDCEKQQKTCRGACGVCCQGVGGGGTRKGKRGAGWAAVDTAACQLQCHCRPA